MITSRRFRSPIVIISLLTLLGLGLRLVQLDFQPLWWDEGYSVWFAGKPLLAMMQLTAADIHPPLYYALLHLWSLPFGLTPVSLRLFSVFVSLPAIPLAYVLGRDLRDRPTAYLAAFLVALNPFAIFYSQEVRMYGLAATLSLAAMWTGWRWSQDRARAKWGALYGISVLAGLYTLYLFALLPLAQFLWALIARRSRLKAYLAALVAAGLLYLPWALYAGPQLLTYVAYKVVKDNDQPLSLLLYLGRHLSAFTVGHLEGPLTALWPWALLLLIPPLAALLFSKSDKAHLDSPVAYLTTILLVALAIGFIQQMRAPFIPEHFERVLLFAAPALWLLIALGTRSLWRESRPAAALFLITLAAMQLASLAAFYITPRYADRDYRPLIATVQKNLRPGDSIFAIFPWQVGYFWAYLPGGQKDVVSLSPDPDWTPAVQQMLDKMLQFGGVWFPEHLSLGGIFETKVENYLDTSSFQLLNEWYGQETRLTGWDTPRGAGRQTPLVTPQAWSNGVHLSDSWFAEMPYRIFFHLNWEGAQVINPSDLSYTLWLQGPDGNRWGQRDVAPFAHPGPPLEPNQAAPWRNEDRIALTLPAGTPPGDYDLMIALLAPDLTPISTAGPNPAANAWLETASLPFIAPVTPHPEHPLFRVGVGIDFLGYDGGKGPALPGDDVPLSLYWQPHGPLSPDQRLFVQLLDAKGRMVAGMEGPPISWLPTTAWDDAPLLTQNSLRIPAALPPGDYRLITGLFDSASKTRVLWGKQDAITLGDLKVSLRQHRYQAPAPAHALDLTLQGDHKLLGYELLGKAQPGAPITLSLYWQPAGPTVIRYRVFVHLIDQNGAILAQDDGDPAHGDHPTTSWLPDEIVTDIHSLTFPAGLSGQGRFGLEVGLYDPKTGQRLPFIEDATGAIIADHIVVPLQ